MRRNWPDLLIGLALVAVIAGIVATLLTGGSLFPLGGGAQDPDPPPAVAAPADPDAAAGGDGLDDAPQDGGLADPLAVPPGAPDPAVDGEASPAAPEPAADADAAEPVGDEDAADGGVAPLAPGDPPTVDVPADPAAEAAVTEPEPAEPQAVAPDPTPEPTPDPSPEPAAESPAPAATAAGPTDPYRISVGAFGDPANAERQAERFRADGYPVFLGTQGNFTLVLVGPYVEEARARAVAAEIGAGDYGIDPVVYVFDPDGGGAAAAAPPDTAPDTAPEPAPEPASPDPAPEPEPEAESPQPAPDTSAGGTLLQVGAFADRASAEPLIERLRELGFSARVVNEDGLVKLVVGPFAGEALDDARTLLTGAGVEHFAR